MPGQPQTRQARVILRDLERDPDWWPTVLDRVAAGEPFQRVLRDWCVTWGAAREWLKANAACAEDLAEAERCFAEGIAYETLSIADGNSPVGLEPDVQRDRLRVAGRQWLAGKIDRPRFGDATQQAAGVGAPTLNFIFVGEGGVPVQVHAQAAQPPVIDVTPMRAIDVSREPDVLGALVPAVESPHPAAAVESSDAVMPGADTSSPVEATRPRAVFVEAPI